MALGGYQGRHLVVEAMCGFFKVISVPIHDVPDPTAFMELLKRMLSEEAS